VAVVSGAVYGLDHVAPILSLGALYLFAVLPVAIFYGLPYAIGVSIASVLAFNFFFLPPLHTLALTDSENWVALAVLLVTAVVVSQLEIAAGGAEALRRSDAAKTAILHAVSHDLRSPLTAIRAASGGLDSATCGGSPPIRKPSRLSSCRSSWPGAPTACCTTSGRST
jgi:K+-sensing histidine kinase KdpD